MFKKPLNKIEIKNEKNLVLPKFKKNIIIKNINFSYGTNDKFSLKIKKFVVKKNQKILIYGDSGLGKSTLFDIIFGLISNKNLEYFVDGNLLNKKKIELFRSNFTFFSPNNYYFNNTVLNNITLFNNSDGIKIKAVCKIVGLDKLKMKNNKFLNKKMGENGSLFSSGEKQRIALARALFNDKEIILLDEPISNLDTKSSNNIIKNILSLDRTIIIISHKKTKYDNYDKIYKFINNKIICEK
jgi:ABC-type bacteriocin/lantibiotic exporter with double-glycine peptidase domain